MNQPLNEEAFRSYWWRPMRACRRKRPIFRKPLRTNC